MAEAHEEVGYIKYSGEGATDGIIDAASAGSALLGLDEALRFFNAQQSPRLESQEYDVPVQTRSGSWEAVVIAAMAIPAAFALGYARKAGEKLAENDFKDIGMKDVLRKSMKAIQTLAKLVKHTGRSQNWKIGRVSSLNPSGGEVVVVNDRGEELSVPLEFYEWYQAVPPRLLVRMTSVVRADRVLSIGVSDGPDKLQVVSITEEEKFLFDSVEGQDGNEDLLFPELEHGQTARLEGRLIRGSQASNSMGLEYGGHVINCIPAHGNVRQYKSALFLRCVVEGRVTRFPKNRLVADRRPTIIVERVIPVEGETQISMFGP